MGWYQKIGSWIRNWIFHNERRTELRHIIWLVFTIISMSAVILMGIFFYYRYSREFDKNMQQGNLERMEQASYNITAHLQNMMKISDSLYYQVIKGKDLAKESISNDLRLIYDINKDYIESIVLFSEDGRLITATPAGKLRSGFSVKNTSWYEDTMKWEENIQFNLPEVSNIFQSEGVDYSRVIPMTRMVQMNINNKMERGILLMNLRYNSIQDMVENTLLGGKSYVYLTDEFGDVIYHPYQEWFESGYIKVDSLPDIRNKHELPNNVICKTIGYTGWNLVGIGKNQGISLNGIKSQMFIAFLILFFLNAILVINFSVSQKITEPMRRLERAVRKIEAGDLDVKIESSGVYEVWSLSEAVGKMEKNLKQLMKDIVEEHEAKRKSDILVLQNQINPHFLYNTLDIIVWMIENEERDNAVNVVTALARFFRISLSKGKSIITVADELEHVRSYLMIQKMRFKDKFSYRFEVDERTESLGTTKLVLQPIVENAIYHAMEYLDEDGEIVIRSYLKGSDLIFSVEDNGCGMTEDKVEALLKGENISSRQGSGVGLSNVMERLHLLFGDAYDFTIISEPDEGTKIQIRMPATPYEKLKEKEGI